MKKLFKLSLLILVFIFNINVFATNDNLVGQTETGQEENENTEDKSEEVSGEVDVKSSDATLKNVYINEQKVVCTDNICEFVIEDNSIEKVTITYETNHEKAKLSKDKISETLKEGENTFSVTVTAEDKTEKEYTFKVTKKLLSTDSSLKKLVINGTEITLKEEVVKYQTTVSHAAKKIEINAETNDSKAVIKDFKNNEISYDFFEEEKEIKIKVEAEAGEITTYVINVTRREEEDATLSNLSISNVSFEFESGVFDYEITVLRNIEKLNIEYETTDSNAVVKLENPKKLEFGENIVKLEVTNDGNTKTYTIKVTKLDEEDKGLANLESLNIEGYELDFKEDKYEYNLKIGDVNFLSIDAIPKIEDADIEITGNLDLVDGSIIKIKVTYDEETTNIYKINISKEVIEENNDNTLKLIIIIVGVSLLVIIAIIIIILIIKKRKNKDDKDNNKENKEQNKDKSIKTNQEEVKKSQDIISITSDEEIEDII